MADTAGQPPGSPLPRRAWSSYGDVQARVSELIATGELGEAVRLMGALRGRFAPTAALAVWAAGVYARVGDRRRAINELTRAIGHGRWWAPEFLRSYAPLESLREDPQFLALIDHLRRWRSVDLAPRPPTRPFVVLPTGPPVGALVALHGAAGSAPRFAALWMAATELGLALIVPQSSQPTTSDDTFGWYDGDRARREVITSYARVSRSSRLEGLPVILAGFSQGADLAATCAVDESFGVVRGFIGVSPLNTETAGSLGERAASWETRICLMAGEYDWARASTERLFSSFRAAGVECDHWVMLGIGHALSADFPDRVRRAVRFVMADRR